MDHKNIDTDHLTVSGNQGDDPNVLIRDDVMIVVTQAYGPRGDSLVGLSDVTFGGYPAVTVRVRSGEIDGLVHLSPVHGDRRKAGLDDIPLGSKCELLCPVSGAPLDIVDRDDASGADYYALYLTPRLSKGEMVALSNIWGDYHSRIVDNFELVSSWATQEEELAAE